MRGARQGGAGRSRTSPALSSMPASPAGSGERLPCEDGAANLFASGLGKADQSSQHGLGDDVRRQLHPGDGAPQDRDRSRPPGAPHFDSEIHGLRRGAGRWSERAEHRAQPFRIHPPGELHLAGEEPDLDPGQSRLLRQEGSELDGSEERVHLVLGQQNRFGRAGPDLEDLEPGAALEGIGGRRRGLLGGGRAEERSRGEEQEEIRARIEPELKSQAEALFSQLGLSATQAIRLFYKQATLQRGLPFAVRLPNAETREALRQAREHEDLTEYESLEDEGRASLIRAATRDEARRLLL